MHHKYDTRAIVLTRSPHGEANALLTMAASGLGLVRARAQGVRKPGAKLASALVTFAESDVSLIKGKEGWRIAGAVLREPWFYRLTHGETRARAARVMQLVLRLAPAEAHDHDFYTPLKAFLEALEAVPEPLHEAAEMAVVAHLLAVLGLDAGEAGDPTLLFDPRALDDVRTARAEYIHRINHGITASGL